MRQGKTTRQKIFDVVDEVVNTVVLAVFLLLFIYGAYVQWDSRQMLHEAAPVAFEAYKPADAEHLSFTQLTERYEDVFGWLTLDGTKIDYPLVQGPDNEKYINTTVTGEFALSGSIFLDYRNHRDMSDTLSVLHGHHMADDVMFGGFDHFADRAYFDAHRSGSLFYDGVNHALELFAFLRVDAYDNTVYSPGEPISGERAYLELLRSRAEQWAEDADLDSDRRILLMSTCEAGETNGRMLLAAFIGDELPAGESVRQPDAGYLRLNLIRLLSLVLILLLGILLIRRNKKKQEAKTPMKTQKAAANTAAEAALPERRPPSLWSDILSLLIKLALIGAAFAALFTLVFGLQICSDQAMAPAIKDRDLVVFYRFDKTADVRELVIYEDPSRQLRIGRIVAGAGDRVDVTSDGLKINGYFQQEDYAQGETLAYRDGAEYPVTLGEGEYFILGDNREKSEDSRVFGPIRPQQIKGRVITVIRRRNF